MTKRQRLLFGMTIITTISTFTIVSCGSGNFLVGRGSNSISPLTSLINHQTLFNLIYSPDGSTFGARAMAQKNIKIDLGMVSSRKAPGTLGEVEGIDYTDEKKGKEEEIKNWYSNKVRTLTFAIDAIGIGINLPINIKDALNGDLPLIDFDNLAKIYSLNKNNNKFPTWKELLVNPQVQNLNNDEITQPVPLGIEGGVLTSGKSEAFIDKIETSKWFQDNKDNLPIDAIKTHDNSIIPLDQQVSDREQEMYSKNNNRVGSIMYYSLGYIIRNNQQHNVTLAGISNNGKVWGEPTMDNAQDGSYPWIRPFNIIYQTTHYEVAVKENSLVSVILSETFQNQIKTLGFVRLSAAQITLQRETHKIIDSDEEVNKYKKNFDYGLKIVKE